MILRTMTIFSVLVLIATHSALAESVVSKSASKSGVEFQKELLFEGKPYLLNGLGVREATVFSVDVYVAGLYLGQTSSDPRSILELTQPAVLILRFVREVDRESIQEAWLNGMKKNCQFNCADSKVKVEILNQWMVDLKKGSEMKFVFSSQGVTTSIDGKLAGKIDGQTFAQDLLALWLGKAPANSGLKKGLLGQ